jgi:hypothetical protein
MAVNLADRNYRPAISVAFLKGTLVVAKLTVAKSKKYLIFDFYCDTESCLWGVWHRIVWQVDIGVSAEDSAFFFMVYIPTMHRHIETKEEYDIIEIFYLHTY